MPRLTPLRYGLSEHARPLPSVGSLLSPWSVKKLCTSYNPIFKKIPKYCFNTSNGTETITVYCFFTLPGLSILQLSQARSALKIAIPRLQHKPAWYGKRTAVFLLVGQAPMYACAVASMLWESCPVTRSPSCGRLHRQTVKPLPPPTVVSSSTYLFGSTDHGAGTASSGANTTKMRWQQRQNATWDDVAVIFSLHKACRRPAKKKIAKLICLREFETQLIVCNTYCREFEAVIFCLHHCVRARLHAMLHLLPP